MKYKLASILFLIFILLCLVTSSIAWFSLAEKNQAISGKVKVEASPNLIISYNEEDVVNKNTDEYFTTSISTICDIKLTECTHTNYLDSTTGLSYISNKKNISRSTGTGDDLEYLPAINNDKFIYYIDSIVYISSANSKFICNDFIAKISTSGEITNKVNSLSVDFYDTEVTSDNYRGTLNIANLDISNHFPNNYNGNIVDQVSFNYKEIPHDSAIKIICRIYFDGALLQETNKTYINSKTIDSIPVDIKISFIAME